MIHGGSGGRALAALVLGLAFAPAGASRAACADREPLRRPFFGDLHVHTRYSLDASTQGTRNRPRDAYRFARGEPLGIQPYDAEGRAKRGVRLARPLDFAAVTDHAELFGELTICETPGLVGHDSWPCWLHREHPRASFFVMNTLTSYFAHPTRRDFCGEGGVRCREAAFSPWRETQEAAAEAQDESDACAFTTFVGYEWTGGPGSNNIHRNVIFRSAAVPALPITYVEEPTPQGLWRALARECQGAGTGCDAVVIPHNSNLSNGTMFDFDVRGGDPAAARERAAIEPLVEVMQHKGDSECRPGLGTPDELCGFEKLPYQNFAAKFVPWLREPPPASSFVREALKQGLVAQQAIGANPYVFGLVASTDTHLAAAGLVDESADYPGHGGAGTPAASELPPGLTDDVEFNPGGLAVLWAEENSRESLFEAMRRREAYGTSGPRLVVRLFGGAALPPDLCERGGEAFAAAGYAHGVPMGGVLEAAADRRPPRFAVWALRDPGTASAPGTKLERIQIVKGWLAGGAPREAVIDAALAPEGRDALCVAWQDPDFDPTQPAFYYARVVERPTPRWSALACAARGVTCADGAAVREGDEGCCDPAIPKTIQERAWTSPIWVLPARP